MYDIATNIFKLLRHPLVGEGGFSISSILKWKVACVYANVFANSSVVTLTVTKSHTEDLLTR